MKETIFNYFCETCKKEIYNFYEISHFIFHFMLYENKKYKDQIIVNTDMNKHFCNIDCFLIWIKEKLGKLDNDMKMD